MASICKHGQVSPCTKCDREAMQTVKLKWQTAEKGWNDCSEALQRVSDERDKYKLALNLAVAELAKKNRHNSQETCEAASSRVLAEIDLVIKGTAP